MKKEEYVSEKHFTTFASLIDEQQRNWGARNGYDVVFQKQKKFSGN